KSGDLRGVIRDKAAAKIALALPPTEAGLGTQPAEAAEIGKVLRDDLEFSGWFAMLDPGGEGRIPADRLQDPAAWREVGAAQLVTSRLKVESGRGEFNVKVIETGKGTVLMDKTWGGKLPADLRRLAHIAADEIVLQLTGRPGIAQTRIAFVSGQNRVKEVFLMDYDGARVRRLTSTGTINLSPAWSPDSRQLTFLSFKGRKPSIYLLDESGKIITLAPKGGELNAAPDYSPDGRTIAFSSDRDRNSEIYSYDVATGREARLTNHPAIDTAPVWSPTGTEIAFTSDRAGSPQIYVMSATGGNVRRLSNEGRYNESAAWSPDGGRIVYVSRIDASFQLVLHELATGKETILTSGRGNKENPRWAPDGRHIVFSSNRDGNYAIWVIRDDGTDLKKLTTGEPAFTPDWSPIRR
ncbi:MAG: Tol-Pal system beta propeller repeat protein TolB, partial [Acidobacteria bacterium]|nr:Tol-Pal system beta propeller repeat protein TolB [Acidobacteriota bacterium]